jgi:hypothetical protein
VLGLSPAHPETGPLPPLEPPRTGASAPRDAAVVIGVARYGQLAPVPYADRDAQLFHRFLLDTVGVKHNRISNLDGAPGIAVVF